MPLAAVGLIFISTFLHAGWNLLLRWQRVSYTFLRTLVVVAIIGLGPTLAAELTGTPFPRSVWGYLVLAGICQAVYFMGLMRGYQHGDFTVVYPIARALPILLLALMDAARGNAPTLTGWLGMFFVSAGCLVIPMESPGGFSAARYWNRAIFWAMVTALGTVGYTTVDKLAAEQLMPGPASAARYGIYEICFSLIFLWLALKIQSEQSKIPPGWQGWVWPAVAGAGMFGAYWLILWSYQLSSRASYVVTLRQFSIVLGVGAGAYLFREPAPGLRISAALTIVAGIILIALSN